MSSVLDIFEKEASQVIADLKKSYADKKMIATGRTVNSLRGEATESGFKIYGADWIEFSEFGRGPLVNKVETEFLKRLTEWAMAVGFPLEKVPFLRYFINENGTRLHRGVDPRFVGKQSKVLTDVLNEGLIENLKEKFSVGILKDFRIQIRKEYD